MRLEVVDIANINKRISNPRSYLTSSTVMDYSISRNPLSYICSHFYTVHTHSLSSVKRTKGSRNVQQDLVKLEHHNYSIISSPKIQISKVVKQNVPVEDVDLYAAFLHLEVWTLSLYPLAYPLYCDESEVKNRDVG